MANEHKIRQFTCSADEVIEIMEIDGYMGEKELKEYLGCLYTEDAPISKEEFIKRSYYSVSRVKKYEQFLNGDIKYCNDCKNMKPLDSFYVNKTCYLERDSKCKKCRDEYNKRRYHEDPRIREVQRAKVKRYKEKNKEKAREIRKNWLKNNPVKARIITSRRKLNRKLEKKNYPIITFDQMTKLYYLREEEGLRTYIEVLFKYYKSIDYPLTEEIREYLKAPNMRIEVNNYKVAEMLKAGYTQKKVAEELETSATNIGNLLRRYGGKEKFLALHK